MTEQSSASSASKNPLITPGRSLLLVANLLYSCGAFLADWNETHVMNPNWPPHARFHNGQTMSLGTLLAAASIYFTFLPTINPNSKTDDKDALTYAAVIGSFYCLAGLSAILYPGSAWKDPDITVGGSQGYLFSFIVVAVWAGYALEVRRIGKAKRA